MWVVAAVANTFVLVAYLAISGTIVRGLRRSDQTVRDNPLGWERQRQALEIHDNVVQGLATAKISFELGRHDEGLRAVEDTLARSRGIITDLLGDQDVGSALGPGDLRRRTAASP